MRYRDDITHPSEIDQLREEVRELRAVVDSLTAARAGPAARCTDDSDAVPNHAVPNHADDGDPAAVGADDQPETIDRRRFVGRAGAIAAGVAGAMAGAAITRPAAAADGQNIVIGSSVNTGSFPTGLAVIGNAASYGFGVTDNGLATFPPSIGRGAVFGHSKGVGIGSGGQFDYGVIGYGATNTYAATGVLGHSPYIGVEANCPSNGIGLWARSASGTAALVQSSQGIGVETFGRQGALRLLSSSATPPPERTTSFGVGTLEVDNSGDLWFCSATGTPGTWRKVSGTSSAGSLSILVAPVRVYDSRPGLPPLNVQKARIDATVDRVVDMTVASSGVPKGATAVLINLAATETDAGGYLGLFANGIEWPGNASINWDHAGQNINNLGVVKVDAEAKLKVRCLGSTHFVIDVIGYFG